MDEILRRFVLAHTGAMGEQYIYTDDNSHLHRISIVGNWFEMGQFSRMTWSFDFSDGNLIRHS